MTDKPLYLVRAEKLLARAIENSDEKETIKYSEIIQAIHATIPDEIIQEFVDEEKV